MAVFADRRFWPVGGPVRERRCSVAVWVLQLLVMRRRVRWLAVAWSAIACSSLLLSLVVLSFWSCESSMSFAGKCKRRRKIYMFLAAMGLFTGPAYRCPVPLMGDPYSVGFPKVTITSTSVPVRDVTYVVEERLDAELPMDKLFGGNQTWQQREESFIPKPGMKIHCGFADAHGPELMSPKDRAFGSRCRFVVASGIFDKYDEPHQPSNDEGGGTWVGIWRVLELKSLPYDEPRRNGKVPKLLLHRLFPEAQYSVWVDGKLELVADPILVLERYLWRGHHSFAIAQHKHHRSVYEEADACKRRKRYARPLIDKHMEVYRSEGLQPWSPAKLPVQSDVPEGALIVREHTPVTNHFSCLWFNEVHRFTPRDQLSFGYVLHRLNYSFRFFMFPNCEYNALVVLHKHVREHSSMLEWVKRMDELPEHLARHANFSGRVFGA